MPKPGSKDIYKRLLTQCENMSIPLLPTMKDNTGGDPVSALSSKLKETDVILDAIFGFSFSPPVRAPFDAVLPLLARSGKPIVSVDIPSGWDVEKGKVAVTTKAVGEGGVVKDDKETEFEGLDPDVLISLTAPKLGVKEFKGRHFLGGRFVSKCVGSDSVIPLDCMLIIDSNLIGHWRRNLSSTSRSILNMSRLLNLQRKEIILSVLSN